MKLKQTISQQELLEKALRRYGVEGEDAFCVLALQYFVHFRDTLANPPERLLQRGKQAYDRIGDDGPLASMLDSVVLLDPTGEALPVWYQYFVGRRFREGSGKFFTPHSVASAMASLLPKREDAVIMDPTCGGGTFLLEASRRWGSMRCTLVGNDIEPSLVDLASLVLELGTPRHHAKHVLAVNIYDPEPSFEKWYATVDCILANPPFSLHVGTVKTHSKLFALGYRSSDAIFLDICYDLLRLGGRLACLLPHSIVANAEFQRLRAAVEQSWYVLGVIGMPEGVFHLTASTTTRADIVILEKREAGTEKTPKAVFAFAPSVGIPLNGRRTKHDADYLRRIATDPTVVTALGI
ncbi:MAG: N-6 DNA methylase [Chloroflexi bacterium]|nr:N-6 DNA methylase [Chloroflexota bacterium]